MSTLIDLQQSIEHEYYQPQIDETEITDFPKTIRDLSLSNSTRLEFFIAYCKDMEIEYPLELISGLTGMYQFSGAKILEVFLYDLCTLPDIPSIIKIEASKSLLAFSEIEEDINEDDEESLKDIKKGSNIAIRNRNNIRTKRAYNALNNTCKDLTGIPTPCKIKTIVILMACADYKTEADSYFRQLISDSSINCDYRYKSILSLEYKTILTSEFFIKNACLDFLDDSLNMVYYRILAGQYLLQKSPLDDDTLRNDIELKLLTFARDEDLDYDRRADAADVILNIGCKDNKIVARSIIMNLGTLSGNIRTIFNNAQNVHNEKIEDSVAEVLEFLSTIDLLKIGDNYIDFDYTNGQIEAMLKYRKEQAIQNNVCENTDKKCKYCEAGVKDDQEYCCSECVIADERQQRIKVALNRIYIDRALYSKYNNTLVNIFLKIYSYLQTHECKDEMTLRLLEELEEMSGTCSTGFASRLINVISGFGDFNIRISWSDQLVANFTGRLNAMVRKINDPDSIFRASKVHDVVELWLNTHCTVKNSIIYKLTASKSITDRPKMTDIIGEYLSTDREAKITSCIEYFTEQVYNEMTIKSSHFSNRQHFLLFFRANMLAIREELYEEFKNYISDVDFDLYIRKAIMIYEGDI